MLEELVNGRDWTNLASCRLAPNQVTVGPRLLARILDIGLQSREAGQRPAGIREPLTFSAILVDDLDIFVVTGDAIVVITLDPPPSDHRPLVLLWTHCRLRYAA